MNFTEGRSDSVIGFFTFFEKQDYVTRKGEDPYEVGVTYFNESLYVVAAQSDLFDQLMYSLQYSGLGGKRTSGYG